LTYQILSFCLLFTVFLLKSHASILLASFFSFAVQNVFGHIFLRGPASYRLSYVSYFNHFPLFPSPSVTIFLSTRCRVAEVPQRSSRFFHLFASIFPLVVLRSKISAFFSSRCRIRGFLRLQMPQCSFATGLAYPRTPFFPLHSEPLCLVRFSIFFTAPADPIWRFYPDKYYSFRL